MKIEEILVHII